MAVGIGYDDLFLGEGIKDGQRRMDQHDGDDCCEGGQKYGLAEELAD